MHSDWKSSRSAFRKAAMAAERQHLEAIAAIDPDEAMQQQSTQSSSFAASTANDRFGQFRTFQSACPICTQELTPPADPARLTFALARLEQSDVNMSRTFGCKSLIIFERALGSEKV
jgi:hypothetical protein